MAQNNNDEIQNLININQRWEQYAKKQDAEIRQLQSQVAMLFAMNMSNNSSSSSSFEQQTCLSCEETQRTANTYRQEVEKLRNELDKLKQVIGALEERTWSLQQERNELNFCLAEANKRFGSLQETMQTRENEYQDELVSADARCQVSLNEAWDRCELLEVKLSTAKQALEQASMDAAEELNKAFSENVQIEAKALREAQAEAEKRRLVEKEAQKAIKKAEEQFKELESRNRVAKELLFLPGEEEAIQAGEFKVFSLTPKREHVFQAEALHFRTAESQFYRLLEGLAQQYDLLQVDYIVNPRLKTQFQQLQQTWSTDIGKEQHPVWCFHGTAEANIEPIIRNGFDIAKVGSATDPGWYGRGIYFSEYASYSLPYIRQGQKLLMCQVLLGKCYQMPTIVMGAPLQPGYHSHCSPDSKEIVAFNAAQMLPTYVIHYRPSSGVKRVQ